MDPYGHTMAPYAPLKTPCGLIYPLSPFVPWANSTWFLYQRCGGQFNALQKQRKLSTDVLVTYSRGATKLGPAWRHPRTRSASASSAGCQGRKPRLAWSGVYKQQSALHIYSSIYFHRVDSHGILKVVHLIYLHIYDLF